MSDVLGGIVSYWIGLRVQQAQADHYRELARRAHLQKNIETMLNRWQGRAIS